MKWKEFQAELEEAFDRKNIIMGSDYLIETSKEPIFLKDLIERILNNNDSVIRTKDLKNKVCQELSFKDEHTSLLLETEYSFYSLFSFFWKDKTPNLRLINISLLEGENNKDYICILQVARNIPWQVVASYDRLHKGKVLPELFELLFHENGRIFDLNLFPNLPISTFNFVPQLIPLKSVFVAYWSWLEWKTKLGDPVWKQLNYSLKEKSIKSNNIFGKKKCKIKSDTKKNGDKGRKLMKFLEDTYNEPKI